MNRVGQLITQAIGEAMRQQGLDSGAAEPWGYAIVGAVHLAGDWWLERRTMPRERLVDYLTSLVWDGMQNYRVPDAGSRVTITCDCKGGRHDPRRARTPDASCRAGSR